MVMLLPPEDSRAAHDHAQEDDHDARQGAEADPDPHTDDEGPDRDLITDVRGDPGLAAADGAAGEDTHAVVQGHR